MGKSISFDRVRHPDDGARVAPVAITGFAGNPDPVTESEFAVEDLVVVHAAEGVFIPPDIEDRVTAGDVAERHGIGALENEGDQRRRVEIAVVPIQGARREIPPLILFLPTPAVPSLHGRVDHGRVGVRSEQGDVVLEVGGEPDVVGIELREAASTRFGDPEIS